MTKLLSNEELRKSIEEIIITDDYSQGVQMRTIDEMERLIDTQKCLYAEGIKKYAEDMAQFITALLIQSGGSAKVTNRTLKEMHYKLGLIFERFDDIDGSIELRLKKED